MQPSDTLPPLSERLSVFHRLQQAIWVYDIDEARVVWSNNSGLDIWQADSLDALRERDLGADMTETVAKRLCQYQSDFISDESAEFREIWTVYPNGEPTTVDAIYSGIVLDDGRMGMFCEARKDGQFEPEALRSAEALLHTSVMITLYTASGEPLYRNPAARSMARSLDETLDNHFHDASVMQLLSHSTDDEINLVSSVNTIHGETWHDITARRCLDAVSGEQTWLISEVDVSRLKATEARAQFLAEHDTLTGLPNRNHVTVNFQNRIDQIMAHGQSGALIFIDLDQFKDVNDTLGHASGDQLLVEVARRLTEIITEQDAVARLGGDEFLLLSGPITNPMLVQNLCSQILDAVSRPINLQGREVSVTPSIGISVFPDDGRKILSLMRHADLAMYHTKATGKNGYAYFSQELSDAVEHRINLDSELLVALKESQFVTYFQPRVDIRTNQISGAEALVRWQHPEKGLIPPGVFIPACEASGLIGELGKLVFRHSVQAQREWACLGFDLKVSVNLSPIQFGDEQLVEDLIAIIEEEDGNPALIELEITESVLLGHDQSTIEKLHALVDHGFRIAIDDFGTGYSNLAYLHRYPIRCLKIDRSFIQQLDSAQPIIELIVSMARLFKLDVVAEGVETQDQLDTIRAFDCQEYQGYLFERPIMFGDFTILLESHQQLAA